MATRNRTPIYRKYRDALRNVRLPDSSLPSSSSAGGGGRSGGPVIEMVNASFLRQDRSYVPLSTEDPSNAYKAKHPKSNISSTCRRNGALTFGLPPAWVDISEEISVSMQSARTKISQLVKAHAKALMPSFGDGRDDEHMIEILTQEITDLLKKSERRLHKLSTNDPSEDSTVRKNVQRSLATDLQKLSMDLRKHQSSYLKRLRQQKEGSDNVDLEMNLNGGSRSRIEDEDFDDVIVNALMTFSSSHLLPFGSYGRELVVESVNDLAQIMKDLSVLVIDQGTIIDRIDYNVQNVATSVEDGYKQLQKSSDFLINYSRLKILWVLRPSSAKFRHLVNILAVVTQVLWIGRP
ncbi:Syntaxin-41 [Platanthera guangdongensis]|uniref:Syntaxin-41 n=1 Tax=Platanthera guangdongensis TaxID=2320717 RepID=A0ABR2LRE6_9ASPA